MIDDQQTTTVNLKLHIDKDRDLFLKICSMNENNNSIEKGLTYWGKITKLMYNYSTREILFIFRTKDKELIGLLQTNIDLTNFVVIGYMLGLKILKEDENLYINLIINNKDLSFLAIFISYVFQLGKDD